MSGTTKPWEFFSPAELAGALNANQAGIEANFPHIAYALDGLGMWDLPTVIAALATVRIETNPDLAPIEEYRNADGSIPPGWHSYGGGARYHGRGFIQLTHDFNYATYGDLISVDLIANPELALNPSIAAWLLAYYFRDHGRPNMQALAHNAWMNTSDWRPTRRYVQGALAGYDLYQGYIDNLAAIIDEHAVQPALPDAPAPPDPCAALRAALAEIVNRKPRYRAPAKKELVKLLY